LYHASFIAGISSYLTQRGHDGWWGLLSDGWTIAVPPFLVLSGLLLYRPYAVATLSGDRTKTQSAPVFWWRRALRILPGYWLMAVIGLIVLSGSVIDNAWNFFRPILLLTFYWPNGPYTGFEVTWTVMVEMVFYLLLPGLAWVINIYARQVSDPARRARRMLVPLVILTAIAFAWTVWMFTPSEISQLFTISFWPPRYLDFYALGMVLATLSAYVQVTGKKPALYRFAAAHPLVCWLCAAIVFVINARSGVNNDPSTTPDVVGTVFILLFAFFLFLPLMIPEAKSRLIDVLTASRPIRFVGRIAFGIYLWHMVFLYLWLKDASVFGHPAVSNLFYRGKEDFWPMLLVVLPVTLVTAAASYYFFERPIANRFRNTVRPWRFSRGQAGRPEVLAAQTDEVGMAAGTDTVSG
jgi:peptidoglycan/LPS O-acetylase OafA/YrhL